MSKKNESIIYFLPSLFGLMFLFLSGSLKSQPIPLELFASDGSFLQSTISLSRPFYKESPFKILNISSFEAHKKNEQNNSSVMITDVSYSLSKRISAGIGITYNSVSGLAPTIGMGYGYHGRQFNMTLAPAYIFSTESSMRLIFNVTYKPRIKNKINLYLSSSNLFTYELNGEHIRSYEKIRVGIDYKTFQYGIGVNYDQFGIKKVSRITKGIFVRKEF